jgi:hypothetical protein
MKSNATSDNYITSMNNNVVPGTQVVMTAEQTLVDLD